jgi:hypothetical protein
MAQHVDRDRNMIRHASKVNWEKKTVEMLAFNQVINKVKDHLHSLHEQKSNDGVDGDVVTSCYH